MDTDEDISGSATKHGQEEQQVSPSRWLLGGALLVSALVRFLAHPPLQVSHLIWVALIGYFFFFNRVRTWSGLLIGTWGWGMLFFLPSIAWIRHISVFAWLGLSGISAAFPLVFAVLLHWLAPRPGVRQLGTAACAWGIGEFVQTHFLSGFPYLFLSHALAEVRPLIQISELTGAWGVSFLIVLVNGVLYLLLEKVLEAGEAGMGRVARRFSWKRFFVTNTLVFVMLGGVFMYGFWRLGHLSTSRGPSIAVLQGNIPQTVKNRRHSAENIFERYRKLASSVDGQAELTVWPETMFPYPVLESGSVRRISDPSVLKQFAEDIHTPQLIGVRTIRKTGEKRADFNSAWLMQPDGTLDQFYAKYHLVPFGEYVPGQSWIPGLRQIMVDLLPVPEALWLDAGPAPARSKLMNWNGLNLAPMICYEVVFPGEFRQQVRKGADVVINMSNEAWYKNEAELDQMLAIVRFRSVEHRITTVRATNTGISGFVFPDGGAQLLRDDAGRDRGFEGTMVRKPVLHWGHTVYTTYGNWWIWFSVTVLLMVGCEQFCNVSNEY